MGHHKDRVDFVERMQRLGMHVNDARLILRHAETVQRLECLATFVRNLDDAEKATLDGARNRIEQIAALYPHTIASVDTGNDPRGCVVLIRPRDRLHATYADGESIGVPVTSRARRGVA